MKNKRNNLYSLNTKKKENVTKKRGKFIVFVVILFVLIYIPSFVYWIAPSEVSLGVLDLGEIEDIIYAQGWMIRDEKVVYNDHKGIFSPDIGQGQRVQENVPVASILDASKKDLLDELDKTNKKLLERILELSILDEVTLPEFSRIENQVESKVKNLGLNLQEGFFSDIGEYKRELTMLMNKRFDAIYDYDDFDDDKFNNLRVIGKSTKNQISQNSKSVYAPRTGLISYVIDGAEDILAKEDIDELTREDLKQIKNKKPFISPTNVVIRRGEPLFKIVNDNAYYVLVIIERKDFGAFSQGDNIKMRINEVDLDVSGFVESIEAERSGDVLVRVKLDRFLPQTVGLRDVNISIVKNKHSGYKVRKDSLLDFDKAKSTAKLMVVLGGTTRIIDVNVLGSSEDFVVVGNLENSRGLSIYGQYVLNPQSVREGRFIG